MRFPRSPGKARGPGAEHRSARIIEMSSGNRRGAAGQRFAADGLPRARPGEAGIDARVLDNFLEALDADGIDLHSLVLHRKGRVAAEMYRWPYGPERPRVMHSVAKSF